MNIVKSAANYFYKLSSEAIATMTETLQPILSPGRPSTLEHRNTNARRHDLKLALQLLVISYFTSLNY
ncbi:hypothetical protein [Nostoc sp. 'Peltigera malacea cyanobiont' DB3992]|uniref:hypothetical protein n=1 Tax=Nostoc sp. 'Peltigera malacea cyanobiont' DB3992 TaxID=1206980 RepID=UPI00117E237A|nr:hypothetical protein [Nostoc sp. 'Peltigera malacea cyanobiont' DB3992]